MEERETDRISQESVQIHYITFSCGSCDEIVKALITYVGQTQKCQNCGSENIIPLPQIRVGGGRIAQPPQGNVKQEEHDNRPVNSKTINEDPSKQSTRHQKEHETEFSQNKLRGDTSEKIREDEKKIPLITLAATLIVAAMIGWGGVTWGPNLFARMVEKSSEHLRLKVNPATVQNLIDSWMSARRAYKSIETDLKISLAEMEMEKMFEEAAIVRQAIILKEEDITESRSWYVMLMNNFAIDYLHQPSEVEKLIANVSSSNQIQADSQVATFLQRTVEGLKQLPAEKEAFRKHFEEIFQSTIQ